MRNKKTHRNQLGISGFSIVELVIVIVVITILASISVLGYNSWQQNVTVTQLKNDLMAASAAMENEKNFGTGYPTDVTSLSKFQTSPGVTASGGSVDGKTFCVSAVSSKYPTMYYYVSNTNKRNPQSGDCPPPTVTIAGPSGTQVWMAKNVNTGTMVTSPNPLDPNNGIVEKYCYDDQTSKCTTYGALYTWQEAMKGSTTGGVQGICPDGFHIPTDGEWKIMESNLGMPAGDLDMMTWWVRGQEENVGTKLKEGGSSNFNAKMGGSYSGGFNYIELEGTPGTGMAGYWTSTYVDNGIWDRGMIERVFEGPATYVGRFLNDNPGFGEYNYLRCIKN